MRVVTRRDVIIFVPSLELGGAEVQALCNAEAARRAGLRVLVVTLHGFDSDFLYARARLLLEQGVELKHLLAGPRPHGRLGIPRGVVRLVRAVISLRRLLRSERPRVVYTRLWFASLIAMFSRGALPDDARWIASEENALHRNRSAAVRFARTLILRRSDQWFVPSRGLFDEAVAVGLSASKGRVWPNVVQVVAPRRTVGVPRRLVYLGRLHPQKGLDRLLALAQELSGDRFSLDVVGDGPLRVWLECEISARGLQNTVRLLPPVNDVPGLLSHYDALILTSHFEGFANVLVEAQAAGVIAVAMDVPHGPSDLIRHLETGVLVPDNDVAAMANSLRMMSAATAQAIVDRAFAFVRSDFTIETQALRWATLLPPPEHP